jgi:hypothetical protein
MTLPNYAVGVPKALRVQILCRGKCGKSRYAKVSVPDWDNRPVGDPTVYAQCLKCGYRATDPYNWARS